MKTQSILKMLIVCCALLSQAAADPYALGADISWVHQREKTTNYRQSGESQNKNMLDILKANGFNYIRLRLFVDPAATDPSKVDNAGWNPYPYSSAGYCGLDSTIAYAKKVKAAGFKFLLDFHYSDTWADPGKQYKPKSWEGLNFQQLTERVYTYTKESLEKFKAAGALPDMVQVGNEVVHGMIHPDGSLSSWANFARLVNAGINGVRDADENILIMMHTITRNDNGPADAWVTNLRTNLNSVETNAANKVDVIGLSYYPKWHGNLDTLSNVVNRIANQTSHGYKIAVVEYADYHREVNDIIWRLPESRRFGTFVWEPQEFDGDESKPLFTWTGSGSGGRRETNARMDLYPVMAKDFGLTGNTGVDPIRLSVGAAVPARPSVTVRGRTLYVSSPYNNELQIRVVDVRGKVAARFVGASPGRPLSFSLANIPAGRYLVDVRRAGIKQTLSVITSR